MTRSDLVPLSKAHRNSNRHHLRRSRKVDERCRLQKATNAQDFDSILIDADGRMSNRPSGDRYWMDGYCTDVAMRATARRCSRRFLRKAQRSQLAEGDSRSSSEEGLIDQKGDRKQTRASSWGRTRYREVNGVAETAYEWRALRDKRAMEEHLRFLNDTVTERSETLAAVCTIVMDHVVGCSVGPEVFLDVIVRLDVCEYWRIRTQLERDLESLGEVSERVPELWGPYCTLPTRIFPNNVPPQVRRRPAFLKSRYESDHESSGGSADSESSTDSDL